MDFDELMKKEDKSDCERLLVQGICTATSAPGFTHLTPWETFEKLKGLAKECFGYQGN
jgi:hypothetical protein